MFRAARERGPINEALKSFSCSVAHDLRAPLDTISGFIAGLREARARGDEARVDWLATRTCPPR